MLRFQTGVPFAAGEVQQRGWQATKLRNESSSLWTCKIRRAALKTKGFKTRPKVFYFDKFHSFTSMPPDALIFYDFLTAVDPLSSLLVMDAQKPTQT